jgi:HAD superfamily hydrolase (TIGR01509 family)
MLGRMPPKVLLLDVDGTLVDNTKQHIEAWREAFASLGLRVDDETLRRNIGKGGDLFVKAVAGEAWDGDHGEGARELHGQAYKRRLGEVRPVPGVTEFLAGIRQLQIRPVLATSSNPDEVEANLRAIGERADDFLIVDRNDIETSKPAPDVFGVALRRSGADPSNAAAVGDTRWDAEAATKVGVPLYGVLTGAGTRAELLDGGAARVFPDLRSLLGFLRKPG